MTARAFVLPMGVLDAEHAASPHRFTGTIEAKSLPLVFPAMDPTESYAEYHHSMFRFAKAWVVKELDAVAAFETEHKAWLHLTDRAVADLERPLKENEGLLLTRALRDVMIGREAIRVHRLSKAFA